MDPLVENDGRVLPIGHAELLGTREAREGDLPGRRLPGALMGFRPAIVLPANPQFLEGRTLVMADAGRCHDMLEDG